MGREGVGKSPLKIRGSGGARVMWLGDSGRRGERGALRGEGKVVEEGTGEVERGR